MSDHTPVLWAYCPRMMVALAGQQSGLETKAFEKLMPLVFSTERVFGMCLRSSLRMSSARMKTMLGLAVGTPVFLRLLHEMPKESSTTKATQANGKTIFLIPNPLFMGAEERRMIRPAPLLTIAPSYRILSIEAGGAGAQPPCGYLSQARWAYLYARWLFLGRTSENSVMAKFAFWAFCEVCIHGVLRSSVCLITQVLRSHPVRGQNTGGYYQFLMYARL